MNADSYSKDVNKQSETLHEQTDNKDVIVFSRLFCVVVIEMLIMHQTL